jgi:hypothetical protein
MSAATAPFFESGPTQASNRPIRAVLPLFLKGMIMSLTRCRWRPDHNRDFRTFLTLIPLPCHPDRDRLPEMARAGFALARSATTRQRALRGSGPARFACGSRLDGVSDRSPLGEGRGQGNPCHHRLYATVRRFFGWNPTTSKADRFRWIRTY